MFYTKDQLSLWIKREFRLTRKENRLRRRIGLEELQVDNINTYSEFIKAREERLTAKEYRMELLIDSTITFKVE